MERCCPACKLPLARPEGPSSFAGDAGVYCCAGCAQGTGCTCRRQGIVSSAATERPFSFLLDRAIPLEAHLNDWLS
jgi:hypothetical protein